MLTAEEIQDLFMDHGPVKASVMIVEAAEAAVPPAPAITKVKGVWTEAGGTRVCWDTCGVCQRYITRCTCAAGPTEPSYITAWRTAGGDVIGTPRAVPWDGQPTPPAAPAPAASVSAAEDAGIAANAKITRGARVKLGQACSVCGQPVSDENSDLNDDNTRTCFDCQEAS